MDEFEVTRLSTKGQVVIPRRLRELLGLRPGDKFVVVGEGDTVVLKRLAAPERESFQQLISRARQLAKARGITKKDVDLAIQKVRTR